MDRSRIRILTFFGRIGAGLGFSAEPDRSQIVMSRVCQLKYAMSYVLTPLSFKSKRRIELLIYNPFLTMIPQSPQVFAISCSDHTVFVFFTLQTIEKKKCVVGLVYN